MIHDANDILCFSFLINHTSAAYHFQRGVLAGVERALIDTIAGYPVAETADYGRWQ